MEMISGALNCDRLKRYWRRRRYQKLYDETKGRKKLKIVRLGGKKEAWKLRSKQKLQLKIFSPLKALVNIHETYVDMMVKLVTSIGKLNNKQVFGGKNKVAKTKQITYVSCGDHHQVVDMKLVLEIYKRLATSPQF
ncbi:hypothetical protein M5689_006418 [Euphorbia peplus]|nr:hypothetical protein M5689_006418 [Euphorbia peplus]